MSFYRTHRPQKFADLIGQDHIRDTLLQASSESKVSHAYLFCGPRGTGKTTAARILAKAVNCLDNQKGEPCNKCEACKDITALRALDVLEIDAASNRGIDEIRELRENVKFAPSSLKQKVYIIDEVHMLTREAFNALLKTLEEPPAHAMFILATTESHKVPATIISRTQRFDFRRVKKQDIITNLQTIAKAEGIKISDSALDIIAASAEGGHRDSLSLLEQISSFGKEISEESVRQVLGMTKSDSLFALIGAIFNTDPEEGLKIAHQTFAEGGSMVQFNSQVIELLRKVLLYVASGKLMFEDTEENIVKIKEVGDVLRGKFPNASVKIVSVIEKFIESGRLLKDVAYPIVPVEIAIVEAVDILETNRPHTVHSTGISNSMNQVSKSSHPERSRSLPEVTLRGSAKTDSSVTPLSDINKTPQNDKNKSGNDDSVSLAPSTSNLKPDEPSAVPVKELAEPVAEVKVFEQLSDDLWRKIVQNIKLENNSLAALLRDARPMGKDDNFIILGVKFAFHKDKISELDNLKVIETEINNTTGGSYKVRCEIADMKKIPKKASSEEELAAAAEEIFNS